MIFFIVILIPVIIRNIIQSDNTSLLINTFNIIICFLALFLVYKNCIYAGSILILYFAFLMNIASMVYYFYTKNDDGGILLRVMPNFILIIATVGFILGKRHQAVLSVITFVLFTFLAHQTEQGMLDGYFNQILMLAFICVSLYYFTGLLYNLLDLSIEKKRESELLADDLAKSLNEKNSLIKEIHHRVKNNLQIIISLISLQASYINENNYNEKYQTTMQRIKAIADIHEQLYESPDFVNLNFQDYLNKIYNNIKGNYPEYNVEMNMIVQKKFLDPEYSIPCGLIINELITNSYRHAFKKEKQGIIKIIFERKDEENVLLKYTDNGQGLLDDYNNAKNNSLGLKLIESLSNQLNGLVKFSNENVEGFFFEVIFPCE